MIFSGSKIGISDNSGARKGQCIKTMKCSQKKGLKPLGTAVISIRKIRINKNKIERGKIHKSILIRAAKFFKRYNGFFLAFNSNDVILITDKNIPVASRIKGPIYKEFRSKFFSKTVILSNFAL